MVGVEHEFGKRDEKRVKETVEEKGIGTSRRKEEGDNKKNRRTRLQKLWALKLIMKVRLL